MDQDRQHSHSEGGELLGLVARHGRGQPGQDYPHDRRRCNLERTDRRRHLPVERVAHGQRLDRLVRQQQRPHFADHRWRRNLGPAVQTIRASPLYGLRFSGASDGWAVGQVARSCIDQRRPGLDRADAPNRPLLSIFWSTTCTASLTAMTARFSAQPTLARAGRRYRAGPGAPA